MTSYAIDPELAAALPMMPDFSLTDLPAARAGFNEMVALGPAPDATGVTIENRQVPGGDGDPDIPLRIYRPERVAAPAAIYDVHGGGFFIGNVDLDGPHNIELARELGVVVISVEYRLAPE